MTIVCALWLGSKMGWAPRLPAVNWDTARKVHATASHCTPWPPIERPCPCLRACLASSEVLE